MVSVVSKFPISRLFLAATITGALFTGAPSPVRSDENQASQTGWRTFFEAGKPHLQLRYRYEYVDQAGLSRNAHAHTVRTRIGFTSGEVQGFSFLVEGENVSDIGAEKFNDTVNRQTAFPVVADPDSTEINRAEVRFNGLPETDLTAGRRDGSGSCSTTRGSWEMSGSVRTSRRSMPPRS